MVEGCKNMDYEQRLNHLRLTTLETRIRRADVLQVYKILNGLEGVKENKFFVRNKRRGRGNSFKLFKKRVNLDVAKYSFGNRVCNHRNDLSDDIAKVEIVNIFKGRLDKY